MYTNLLIAGHGKMGLVTSLGVEVIDCQADIVPRIYEKYKGTAVDFLHIGAYSGMRSCDFHTHDVDVVPPSDVGKLVDYSRTFLSPANFIQPLVYFGKLASVYQFNPRAEMVEAHKEQFGWSLARRTLKASYQPGLHGHWMVWENMFTTCPVTNFKPKGMSQEDTASRINRSSLPFVVNITLDSLQYLRSIKTQRTREREAEIHAGVWTNGLRESAAYWQGKDTFQCYSSAPLLNEPSLNDFNFQEEECGEENLQRRVENVANFLSLMRKPDLVVVSTSQKPIPTSLPDKREMLEQRIMDALSKTGHW